MLRNERAWVGEKFCLAFVWTRHRVRIVCGGERCFVVRIVCGGDRRFVVRNVTPRVDTRG